MNAPEPLASPTLPAKAHLRSWAAGQGEDPIYVALPNPIAAAARGRMGA